jgi:hypothetical protein
MMPCPCPLLARHRRRPRRGTRWITLRGRCAPTNQISDFPAGAVDAIPDATRITREALAAAE